MQLPAPFGLSQWQWNNRLPHGFYSVIKGSNCRTESQWGWCSPLTYMKSRNLCYKIILICLLGLCLRSGGKKNSTFWRKCSILQMTNYLLWQNFLLRRTRDHNIEAAPSALTAAYRVSEMWPIAFHMRRPLIHTQALWLTLHLAAIIIELLWLVYS